MIRPRIWALALVIVVAQIAMFAYEARSVRQIERIMDQQGLTAAVIAYGQAGEEPDIIELGADASRVFPYFSLSKPITAEVTRMTFDLDDKVEGATVRQILQHTAGWDSSIARDPVTSGDHADCADIPAPVKKFRPGERYAYSNLGYCILGKAIEKKTGISYREAVNRAIPESRLMGFDPYLGPAGGWSGTAEQYFAFASRPLPGIEIAVDIPDTPLRHGLGWAISPEGVYSHFGSLTGAFTVAYRRDEFVAVILFEGNPINISQAKASVRSVLSTLDQRSYSWLN